MERAQDKPDLISKYRECIKLADIYYAYHQVFLFCVRVYLKFSESVHLEPTIHVVEPRNPSEHG